MKVDEYIESKPDPWNLKKIGKNPKIAKMLEKYIGKAGKVIDVGGGNGFYANALQEKGNHVTVLDASKKMISEGKKMFPELKFVHANAIKMPFTANEFDAAICMGTLMYIQDKDVFFKEVHRILKPKAIFLLHERNKQAILNRAVSLFKNPEKSVDKRDMFLKKSQLRDLAKTHEFSVEKIKGTGKNFITAVLIKE